MLLSHCTRHKPKTSLGGRCLCHQHRPRVWMFAFAGLDRSTFHIDHVTRLETVRSSWIKVVQSRGSTRMPVCLRTQPQNYIHHCAWKCFKGAKLHVRWNGKAKRARICRFSSKGIHHCFLQVLCYYNRMREASREDLCRRRVWHACSPPLRSRKVNLITKYQNTTFRSFYRLCNKVFVRKRFSIVDQHGAL
jgi:hypothetical protein